MQVVRGIDNFWIIAFCLVDTWCLGIKDIFLKIGISNQQFKTHMSHPDLISVDYELGRGIALGARDFAKQIGLEFYKTWDSYKMMLIEADRPYTPPPNFNFGKDGKYLYADGPRDNELFNVQEVIKKVTQAKGDYIISLEAP